MAKNKSRSARWAEAVQAAMDALKELVSIQSEYQDWLDNLPENLQTSALGEKLESVCYIDLSSALDMVTDAERVDLPQGFGRD